MVQQRRRAEVYPPKWQGLILKAKRIEHSAKRLEFPSWEEAFQGNHFENFILKLFTYVQIMIKESAVEWIVSRQTLLAGRSSH